MHTLKAVASSTLSLPADNYIYSIVPSAPGTFAAISSDDSLRVFDAADLDRGSVISNATHNGGVTALRSFTMGESHLLATGGRDGKVKVWDVRAGNGSPVVEMETGEFVLIKLFVIYIVFLLGGGGFFHASIACLGCLREPTWTSAVLCFAAAFPIAYYWFSGNLSALGFKGGPGLVAGFSILCYQMHIC